MLTGRFPKFRLGTRTIAVRNRYQETHDCHPMADCMNTDFSYECRCKTGYFKDGDGCFDADECVMKTHNCDRVRAFCDNTEGSYNCICRNGYIESKSKELTASGKRSMDSHTV